jgi:hypothetical protein
VNGEIAVWGSQADADATIGLLARGAQWLADGAQVAMPEEDKP